MVESLVDFILKAFNLRYFFHEFTKKEVEVLHRRHLLEEDQKNTAHMLQCSELAHPCSLDDLLTFNDMKMI